VHLVGLRHVCVTMHGSENVKYSVFCLCYRVSIAAQGREL